MGAPSLKTMAVKAAKILQYGDTALQASDAQLLEGSDWLNDQV